MKPRPREGSAWRNRELDALQVGPARPDYIFRHSFLGRSRPQEFQSPGVRVWAVGAPDPSTCPQPRTSTFAKASQAAAHLRRPSVCFCCWEGPRTATDSCCRPHLCSASASAASGAFGNSVIGGWAWAGPHCIHIGCGYVTARQPCSKWHIFLKLSNRSFFRWHWRSPPEMLRMSWLRFSGADRLWSCLCSGSSRHYLQNG